jgi:hypothetical protein
MNFSTSTATCPTHLILHVLIIWHNHWPGGGWKKLPILSGQCKNSRLPSVYSGE